ncbi:hypothetical protein ANCCEY_05077 [Ancylostoma ceylanicum]|uniref:Uncharacterized protein n=1 Tax=Ancylostoma ceylanicum TaxID=53326 RepID=A0A0D6M7K1_9BILA|nr:hypothetical protein ANCCEY_05077 [Ancylostoma ceylanicum]
MMMCHIVRQLQRKRQACRAITIPHIYPSIKVTFKELPSLYSLSAQADYVEHIKTSTPESISVMSSRLKLISGIWLLSHDYISAFHFSMAAPKAFDGLSKDLSDSDRLELCKMYGTDVVTFIWYRTVQVIWIFIAGIAIFNVSRVYFRYIKSSKLHTNIQILLTLFMFSAVLINTTFIVAQAYQFTLSFVFGEPCDVFLPRTFYIIFNICYGFFTELYLLSKATMIIERSLATIYSSCYEHMKSLPGFLGAIISGDCVRVKGSSVICRGGWLD